MAYLPLFYQYFSLALPEKRCETNYEIIRIKRVHSSLSL
jgi:hypothetical protein